MNDAGLAADLFVSDLIRSSPRSIAAPVCLDTIAESYFGYRCFARATWDWRKGEARMFRIGDRWRIETQKTLPLARSRWKGALLFADLVLRDHHFTGRELNRRRAAVAASLLIPRDCVRGLARAAEVAEHAGDMAVPRAAVLMRLAEVSGVPTAIVHRDFVKVRGASGLLPSDEDALRAFAESKMGHRGVLKVRCDDEPQKAVVMQVRA